MRVFTSSTIAAFMAQATSPNPTDEDHDKYQHVVTYSDETIIKHPYLNIDDVTFAFNQYALISQRDVAYYNL